MAANDASGEETPARIPSSARTTSVRWVIAVLMWVVVVINYLDRTNMAVSAPVLGKLFHIGSAQMGLILSSFFWTYALFQIPQGWFADRVGQRISLSLSATWWSLMTVLMVAGRSLGGFLGVRLLVGMGESGAYPSNAGVTAKWFPAKERARASAIYDSASRIGPGISMPLVAWLLVRFGWQVLFVVSGLLGLVWVVIWWAYYRDPESHKGVSENELKYIKQSQVGKEASENKQPPLTWYQLLKYRNIWAMIVGFFCFTYTFYFLITWFPTFLVTQRHMTLLQAGFIGVIPAFCAFLGELFGGWYSDHLVKRGHTLTFARKLLLVSGMLVGTVISFAALVPSAALSVVLLSISYAGLGFAGCAIWALPGDVAPRNMASTVGGLQNTAANMGGILGPIVTGFILAATHSFVGGLAVSGVLVLIGAGTYLFGLKKVETITVWQG